MTFELWVTLFTLVGAVVLFATELLPMDVVALLVTGVLLLTRVVTLEEGMAGFSSPAVITVALMFVLSAALQHTGALASVGRLLTARKGGPGALTLAVMGCSATVSAFVNNTAAVAVFLPLVMSAARTCGVPASRVLIPLSYAAQFGGVCTLVGTSTNLVVHSIAEKAGVGGFTMFEFAPLGLVMCAVGGAYLMFFGRWLLPARRGGELTETYQLGDYVAELLVMDDSPLIGKRLTETTLTSDYNVDVIEIRRSSSVLLATTTERLQAHDLLLVRGPAAQLLDARAAFKLELEPHFKLKDEVLRTGDLQLCEAIVPPASPYSGRSLADIRLGGRTGVIALAVQRTGQVVREKLASLRLRFGDTLLLLGSREGIDRLRGENGLLILNEIESPALHRAKALPALLVMTSVVVLAALGVLPVLVSALLGVLVLLITRTLRPEHAYAAVDWRVIIMLAAILPLGVAMEKTGAAKAAADFFLGLAGTENPVLVLATFYLLTAVLTEFMSNSGTAVLIAPIAISTAHSMGLDPRPFLIAVTFAASTSFATPVGYQTNTMVYNAGGYKFSDFLRVGIPLNVIFWGLSVLLIPLIWPFRPGG